MCYGMNCEWENSLGDCTWHKGLPYPCSDNYKDEEDISDEKYHEKINMELTNANFDYANSNQCHSYGTKV